MYSSHIKATPTNSCLNFNRYACDIRRRHKSQTTAAAAFSPLLASSRIAVRGAKMRHVAECINDSVIFVIKRVSRDNLIKIWQVFTYKLSF